MKPRVYSGVAGEVGLPGGLIRGGGGGALAEYPLVGEPSVEVVHRPSGQVHEQLREVELRINLVPAAGGGEAGQNRGGAAAALVADEERVLATTERLP